MARVIPAPAQSAGINAAVADSRGRILAFIDSDWRPAPARLERGLAALSGAQIVGGAGRRRLRRPGASDRRRGLERLFAFNFKRYIEKLEFSGSGDVFVPRQNFDRVGGFRGKVAEDLDWAGGGRRQLSLPLRNRRDCISSGATLEMEESLARSVLRGHREAARAGRVISRIQSEDGFSELEQFLSAFKRSPDNPIIERLDYSDAQSALTDCPKFFSWLRSSS
jgi:hypothetical protein